LKEFRNHCISIKKDVYKHLGASNVASKYITEGSAGPGQAKAQVEAWKAQLGQR